MVHSTHNVQGAVLKTVLCPADLVPVYHMGQTQLLTFWGAENLSRRWRASIGIFWGAWGLPLPRKHPIISLVGSPIPGVLPASSLSHCMLHRIPLLWDTAASLMDAAKIPLPKNLSVEKIKMQVENG